MKTPGKYALLLLVLAALVSPALSQPGSYDPYVLGTESGEPVPYGEGGSISWYCHSAFSGGEDGYCSDNPTESDLPNYNVRIYNENGVKTHTIHEYTYHDGGGTGEEDYIGYEFDTDFPYDGRVDHGYTRFELWINTGVNIEKIDEGSLYVKGTKSIPNRAKYIYIKLDKDPEPEQLKAFFLSNDDWGITSVSQGGVGIEEEDGEDDFWLGEGYQQCFYNTDKTGIISDDSSGWSVLDLTLEDSSGDCMVSSGGDSETPLIEEEEFGNSNTMVGLQWQGAISQLSPLHDNGNYRPDGGIARAYEPPETGGDGPYWYVCRDGSDGKTVMINGERYRCDTGGNASEYPVGPETFGDHWRDGESNDWERVYVCSDGLDNDGDGSADSNDPGCQDTWNRESELGSGTGSYTCDPVMTYMKNGAIYGNWSSDSDSLGCGYQHQEKFSTWVSGKSGPQQFTCYKDQSSYSGPYSEEKSFFCNSVSYKQRYGFSASTDDSLVVYPVDNPNMPAVMYYPTYKSVSHDILEEVPTGDTTLAGTTDTSPWITDQGWSPGIQSLHMAERNYDGFQIDTMHSTSTWDTKGVVDTGDGYSYNSMDRLESWTVGNATAPGNDKIVSSGNPGDPGYFTGGFAGKCPEGESWQFVGTEQGWACSGAVSNWLQTVMVPNINGVEGGDETIGIVIMPYNFRELPTSDFTTSRSEVESSTGVSLAELVTYKQAQREDLPDVFSVDNAKRIKNVTAQCKPEGASSWSFTRSVTLDYSAAFTPVAIWGKADVASGSSDKYVCSWWYFREKVDEAGFKKVTNEGRAIDLVEGYSSSDKSEKQGAVRKLFREKLDYSWIPSTATGWMDSSEFESTVTGWEGQFFQKQW